MKKLILLLIILLTIPAFSVNAEGLQIDFLLSGMRDPDTDQPLTGGMVYTYEGGTSTPLSLFTDRDKTRVASNPVILDAYGRAIVFGDDIYRFIVKNASDTIVWSSDGLEYKSDTTTTGQAALTENLDAAGFKIINLGVGSDNEDSVTYNQLVTIQAELESDISDLSDLIATQSFLDLTDTPVSYSGANLKVVNVNAAGNALEFSTVDNLLASSTLLDLEDTPSSFVGKAGYALVVNAAATATEFVAPSGSPVGAITMFCGGVAPSGWLLCNGQEVNSTTYPLLAAALGPWGYGSTGPYTPDMRGMFVKGTGTQNKTLSGISDALANAYSGAALGAYTQDKFQAHDHVTNSLYGGGGVGYPSGSSGITGFTLGVADEYSGAYGSHRSGAYTEPAHVTLNYIIKHD